MDPYFSLASHYDELTTDVDYNAFADYYEDVFRRLGIKAETVLDLACGTGTLTRIMAARGYEMIGVDASAEMLSVAEQKTLDEKFDIRPMYLNQSMDELDLYGTVDATVCCLDGINYISPDSIGEVFHRVNLFTRPGGVFIFDINAPEKLLSLDGQAFVDENEDVFCVWRSEIDKKLNACCYGMDIFSKHCGLWERSFEEHIEYIHYPCALSDALEKAGFRNIGIFGERSFDAPADGEQRIFIISVRK